MGVMRILDHSGDTLVRWSVDDEEALARATAMFDRLRSERKLAFARPSGAGADEAVQIDRFDPAAEEIVWIRPIAGG